MGSLSLASMQPGNPILLYGRHLTLRSSYETADVLVGLNLFSMLL